MPDNSNNINLDNISSNDTNSDYMNYMKNFVNLTYVDNRNIDLKDLVGVSGG